VRDTCVFICFLWLADVAEAVAKSGHPFWALAMVFLLLLAGFHYIEDLSPAFNEDEDDEETIPVRIETLDRLFASADTSSSSRKINLSAYSTTVTRDPKRRNI